jgi:hypothetical protein
MACPTRGLLRSTGLGRAGCVHRCRMVATHSLNRRSLGTALTGLLLAPALMPAPGQASSNEAQFEADVEDFVKQTERAEALTPKQLQALRAKFAFRRSPTGKVQLRSKSGNWYDVRLDMNLPGVCMLRAPSGDIYILQLEKIQQIDLSNDLIVMSVFGDAEWEGALEPLAFGEGGKDQLNMGVVEFRESLGILSDTIQVAASMADGGKQ